MPLNPITSRWRFSERAFMVWLVWLQCRKCTGRQRCRCHRIHHYKHCSAAGALTWMFADWYHGKPSSLGMVSGAIAGMVAITPAAGFVTPHGLNSYRDCCRVLCYGMMLLRVRKKCDESLDAWAIHGMGGLWGTTRNRNFCCCGNRGNLRLAEGNAHQFVVNAIMRSCGYGVCFCNDLWYRVCY